MADTPLPEFTYGADGGTFGNLSSRWKRRRLFLKRFDYFSSYSGFGTQNNVPNSQYHRDTYLGNFGYQLSPNTTLRATVRRMVAGFNSSNAVAAYGIPDDAATAEDDTSFGVTLENHASDRWHNLVRAGGLRLRQQYSDYAPTGIPYDPYDLGTPSYYLGAPVTQQGANGYSITPAMVAAIDPSLPQYRAKPSTSMPALIRKYRLTSPTRISFTPRLTTA